jgi:molybdenum cofactor biosynthesis enzyme MoaA
MAASSRERPPASHHKALHLLTEEGTGIAAPLKPQASAGRRPPMPCVRQNLPRATPMDRARRRMAQAGEWRPDQMLGRRWAIGCVALEITQRCNLDCSLCYLSEMSEAVHDVPLEELYRRIDRIAADYGPNTGVQVTGGDPTLRKRSELVAIVRRIHDRGLRASLFTNGIKASRALLSELANAGLADVAFHVDTTQQRKGFIGEAALNSVRAEYIERARGLPITVFFNTTVHDGNFHEICEVARFFVANSDIVRIASFQLQADAGRGVQRQRAEVIDLETVAAKISEAAATPLRFASAAGHTNCNRFAATLVCGGRTFNLFDGPQLFSKLLEATSGLPFDRAGWTRLLARVLGRTARHPIGGAQMLAWSARLLWRMRRALWVGRGRVSRLTFHLHNFMDSESLDPRRIDACAFMVATADGPVSMCLHNAQRDSFILKPLRIVGEDGARLWDPLDGDAHADGAKLPRRHVVPKGRSRIRTAEQQIAPPQKRPNRR